MEPSAMTGQLLGMDQDGILEVTDCFPYVTRAADEEDEDSYQIEMMKALRDVNVDHASVGWYQSTNFDAPLQGAFIEAQGLYQQEIANSVFLVYDHGRSTQGPPSLRAFRLQDSFLAAFKTTKPSPLSLGACLEEGIVVELDVKISLSAMDRLVISSIHDELPASNHIGSIHACRLIMSRLSQNMVLALDESISESARVQHYVRSVSKQAQILAAQKQKRVSYFCIGLY